MKNTWEKAQEFEKGWWGNCTNTFGEETKQLLYANRMGLKTFHNGKSPFNFDMKGKSVLDIGGGPCSLLLKCVNTGKTEVVDPCKYPEWVKIRYELAGISFNNIKGEDINYKYGFDEAWIYNCLQHVGSPEKIIKNAKKISKVIRIFEWIDLPVCEGHPHELTEKKLDKWLGGIGKVEQLTGQNTCKGKCYFGVFPT